MAQPHVAEVRNLTRFTSASQLRAALVDRIARGGSNVTNKNLIELYQRELAMLEPELRRYNVLKPRQRWYGTAVNLLPTLEKVLNDLGYSTKVVRRERNGRQCKEIQFTLNPAFDLDAQTKSVRVRALLNDIEQAQKVVNQKLIALKAMLDA